MVTKKKSKLLSFKDRLTVDYQPGESEQQKLDAKKRKRGGENGVSEEAEQVDEAQDRGTHLSSGQYAVIKPHVRKLEKKHGVKVHGLGYRHDNKTYYWEGDHRETGKAHKGSFKAKVREEVEQTDEALDIAARRKRSVQMRRLAPRIKIARKRALKRVADLPRLKRRSKKQARNLLFKKFSKGKGRSQLSPARRKEIEQRLEKMKGRIDKIALRMLPKVRQMEKERRRPKQDDKK
jgi:hypothetical protein